MIFPTDTSGLPIPGYNAERCKFCMYPIRRLEDLPGLTVWVHFNPSFPYPDEWVSCRKEVATP